jgi:hypothetical protein
MRNLDQALEEISAIRSQIARGTTFRGYGPAALTATALLAVGAAVAQATFITTPLVQVERFVWLWAGTALASLLIVGVEMVRRTRREHAGLADEMLWTAIEQFLPAGLAGGLVTLVLLAAAPEVSWTLPGLWQVIFSIGVFASCRFLPRATFFVGAWYLMSGLVCLAFVRGLSPAAMGIGFGIGQLLGAVILHAHREDGAVDG